MPVVKGKPEAGGFKNQVRASGNVGTYGHLRNDGSEHVVMLMTIVVTSINKSVWEPASPMLFY